MALWKDLFGKKKSNAGDESKPSLSPAPQKGPDISFGHFSDVNKNEIQLKKWHEATDLFSKEQYASAILAFFEYLKSPDLGNVEVISSGTKVEFTIFQGSACIKGLFDGELLSAECILAQFSSPPIPAMRQLLSSNFLLRYSKFAIRGNSFGLFFRSPAKECSPDKLYHGLREMCLKSDQFDDLLYFEFQGLEKPPGCERHTERIPEVENSLKCDTWKIWLTQTLEFVNKLDRQAFSGIISYALLNFIYKTDYLLSPQGALLNELNRIQYIYWDKTDGLSNTEKNEEMIRELSKLAERDKTFFSQNFYRVKSTFGLVTATGISTINEYIAECLKNTDWYVQNKHPDMEMIIYEYTATYCLFNFGLFPSHYRLFHLQLLILNADYFEKLGFEVPFIQNGILNPQAISREIEHIISSGSREYKNLKFLTQNLKYDTLYDFHYSFLSEIRMLNFTKKA